MNGTASLIARLRGTNSRDLIAGWVASASWVVAVNTVNVLSVLADAPGLETWKPWVWEGSSAVALFLLLWIPWLTTAAAPPDQVLAAGWRPKAAFLSVHAVGFVAYSALHVAGFVILRKMAYDLWADGPYEFGERFIYEMRKDLLGYALFVGVLWMVGYLRRRRDEPVRPVSFDIRDGARIIRAPLADILAVSSAGNYVEFLLADGRRPLMRATLAAVEAELSRFGFVRVHRSWLVNAERVTGLQPDGSGDWTVELGAVNAPLSRRYPAALATLRG
jgi:DNA-binding LytR/AlgR family response regulator